MMSWNSILQKEFGQSYFKKLSKKLAQEAKQYTIYPPKDQIFNAFKLCPWDKVKVVIIGQNPYCNPGQAMGLSFSVPEGISIPPSLQNIFKELKSDLGIEPVKSGNLEKWAGQGVLLLNTALTVRKGEPSSHLDINWFEFTNNIIRLINEEKKNIVFLLWGRWAQERAEHITNTSHLVLKAAHPSPYSYTGFKDCKHFSKANEFLIKTNQPIINWNLLDETAFIPADQNLEKTSPNNDNYFADITIS